MQNTTNAFLEGIITDFNPLTMPETALTSALNATIVTGNGNEGLLQNDTGNTLIKDSITGSIMSLNDGFVPIGMKEHGGVLYIASYNPETNEGELGSIPSPIVSYTINPEEKGDLEGAVLSDLGKYIGNVSDISIQERLNPNTLFILNDRIFHCGDKFIVSLNLNLETAEDKELETIRTIKIVKRDKTTGLTKPGPKNITIDSKTYPQISKFKKNSNEINHGWFKILLYSVLENGVEQPLTEISDTPQFYYNSDNEQIRSDYWFLNNVSDIDEIKTKTSNCFRTYPNIPAGRLAIKIVPEEYPLLQCGYNDSFDSNLPQVTSVLDENKVTHNYIIFPSFIFKSTCPVRPDLIKMTCNKGTIHVFSDDTKTEDGVKVVYNLPNIEQNIKDYQKSKSGSIYINKNERLFLIINRKDNTNARGIRIGKGSQDAFIDYDSSSDTYIISKYTNGRTYINGANYKAVENFSKTDVDGLFYIEIDTFDADFEFTLDLYTKSFQSEDNYVLYERQVLPKFNPALELIKGINVEYDYVDQYFDITKGRDWDFDILLFNDSALDKDKQDCFLYNDEGNIILEFDNNENSNTYHKYIPFRADENDQTDHTLEEFSEFKTYIYPQYVSYNDTINKIGQGPTRYIWSCITNGPKIFRTKQEYDDAPSKLLVKERETYHYHYFKLPGYIDEGGSEKIWDWFVVSSILPTITLEGESSPRPYLLPILREKNNKIEATTNLEDSTNSAVLDEIVTIEEAYNQREYFKNQKNSAGFTAELLKKHMLYNTNLNILHVKKLDDIDTQEIGKNYLDYYIHGSKLENESYFNLFFDESENVYRQGELNLYPGVRENWTNNKRINKSSTDSAQGMSKYKGDRYISKQRSGESLYGGGWRDEYGNDRPIFADYTLIEPVENGKRSFIGTEDFNPIAFTMHDNYIAIQNSKNIPIMFGKYKDYLQSSEYNKKNNENNYYKFWDNWTQKYLNGKELKSSYTPGFMTEAFKKCGGYSKGFGETKVVNSNIIKYSYNLLYLYGKDNGCLFLIKNKGCSPVFVKFPNIFIIDNKFVCAENFQSMFLDLNFKTSINVKIGKKEGKILNLTERTLENKLQNNEDYDIANIVIHNSSVDVQIPIEEHIIPFNVDVLSTYNNNHSNIREELLLDTYSTVLQPQFFIQYHGSLRKSNLSDYQISKQVKLSSDYSKGVWIDNNNLIQIVTPNVRGLIDDLDNSTNLLIFNINDSQLSNPKLNSFYNEKAFLYGSNAQDKISTNRTINLNKGLYAVCVSKNVKTNRSGEGIGISLNNGSYSTIQNESNHVLLVVPKESSNVKITLSIPEGIYIKGFGIYQIDTESDSQETHFSLLKDAYNKLLETSLDCALLLPGADIEKYVVFPGVFCYKEENIGCLEKEYDFQFIPDEPKEECIATYGYVVNTNEDGSQTLELLCEIIGKYENNDTISSLFDTFRNNIRKQVRNI